MAQPRAIAAKAANSRTSRTATMNGRDSGWAGRLLRTASAPSPASALRSGGDSGCSWTLIGCGYLLYLSTDEQGPHELVVLVVEDVAVLDVARSGRGGRIEGEHVLTGADPAHRDALRSPTESDARDLAGEHLDGVLPAAVERIGRTRWAGISRAGSLFRVLVGVEVEIAA